jgi:hypothetical protein
MRREGERDGVQAEIPCVRDGPPQKLPMAKVHPVEISDRQGNLPGRGEAPGSLDDIHDDKV